MLRKGDWLRAKRARERAARTTVTSELMIHGVPESQIDNLRGYREPMEQASQTVETIKEDYARVGIEVTPTYAEQVRQAIYSYTGGSYSDMREAYRLERSGRSSELTYDQQQFLSDYKLCMEYCRIAPTVKLSEGSEVIRGVRVLEGDTYSQGLLNLKAGQKYDVDNMPTSFTTSQAVAKDFARYGGIMIHAPAVRLKNAPSVRGISGVAAEDEVFMADYGWKVARISDQRSKGDGRYHIYLEPDKK